MHEIAWITGGMLLGFLSHRSEKSIKEKLIRLALMALAIALVTIDKPK